MSKLMILIAALAAGGCVERTLTFNSNPNGALIYLNDQEVGHTPVTHDFLWYGNYDLTVRMQGYQTLKSTVEVKPPIFQIVPLDLVCELLPFQFKDHKEFTYTLLPLPPVNDQELMQRANALKKELHPSQRPTTQPTKTSKPKR